MLVFIRGAGDLASGVAVRLLHSGFSVILSDIPKPTAIRREVSFCRAIEQGQAEIEDVKAKLASTADEALQITREGMAAILIDQAGEAIGQLHPLVVVDAILAKRNTGTHQSDADVVIGLGPGFTAGVDCHAVVETMRGHDLGRVYWKGSAQPNTGEPGMIGGYAAERLLRAPCDGVFEPICDIGSLVKKGETVARIDGQPMLASIDGVVRGLLPQGTVVTQGMKSGDVDPRGVIESCYTVSDKARAIGGGVLEAILQLTGAIRHV
ncbi:MAG: selenium-dependent molybdenum cofactor biosynthesis protein YqeB [Eubacteriales bacterium]|nr:selenium-dependent molybdenum cofactor biosynthesis protein YqeB [Eubacteriales bacterium]